MRRKYGKNNIGKSDTARHSARGNNQRMRPQVLTTAISQAHFHDVCLVATDMDGTLTAKGEFTPGLLQAFEKLRDRNIKVMIVTGRSAGWVSGLVNYLPVVGAIAENGGIYIDKSNLDPVILPDIPRMSQHRGRLQNMFNRLRSRHPDIKPSVDNPYRLTDWTFDIDGLNEADIASMQKSCAENAVGFTYSTVQCHLKVPHQNKAEGLSRVLQKYFPDLSPNNVITVGDSPNDESLFNAEAFPHSVGVANVSEYLPSLSYQPAYITETPEVEGFLSLVEQLCN